MESREYDIILYGASGFTAKHIIKELEQSSLKIAVAARSICKIQPTFLHKIECSIENINNLAIRTKLLINAVGPYAHSGAAIIRACILAGTHYIDISGETQFLSNSYKEFNNDAILNKVKIIQSCGFDSVPADIGTLHISGFFDYATVESTIRVWHCKINITTWISLLNSLRQYTSVKKTVSSKEQGSLTNPAVKKTIPSKEYRYNQTSKSYDVLFKGSDSYVVKRSIEYFRIRDTISNILRILILARFSICLFT